MNVGGLEVGGRPIWENRFSGLSLARKVGRTCYIRGSFVRRGDGVGYVYSTLLRGLPYPLACRRGDEAGGRAGGRTGSVGGASRKRPARLLEVRSGRIKSYFNVNAAEASVRPRDSFGNTQSRAKIRTPLQSRNAI